MASEKTIRGFSFRPTEESLADTSSTAKEFAADEIYTLDIDTETLQEIVAKCSASVTEAEQTEEDTQIQKFAELGSNLALGEKKPIGFVTEEDLASRKKIVELTGAQVREIVTMFIPTKPGRSAVTQRSYDNMIAAATKQIISKRPIGEVLSLTDYKAKTVAKMPSREETKKAKLTAVVGKLITSPQGYLDQHREEDGTQLSNSQLEEKIVTLVLEGKAGIEHLIASGKSEKETRAILTDAFSFLIKESTNNKHRNTRQQEDLTKTMVGLIMTGGARLEDILMINDPSELNKNDSNNVDVERTKTIVRGNLMAFLSTPEEMVAKQRKPLIQS